VFTCVTRDRCVYLSGWCSAPGNVSLHPFLCQPEDRCVNILCTDGVQHHSVHLPVWIMRQGQVFPCTVQYMRQCLSG